MVSKAFEKSMNTAQMYKLLSMAFLNLSTILLTAFAALWSRLFHKKTSSQKVSLRLF